MVSRLILTLVLISSVTGCIQEKKRGTNEEEQNSGQTQRQTRQDEKAEELYLPGQD